jgi:tetratricopeptide (TPR) repeat protein
VFSIGGGLYDTIYLRTGGGSGGFSNDQLSMYNVQLKEPKLNAENENEKLNDELKVLEIQSGYKNLRDSINFCFRIRDFVTTEQKCKVLLTNYPDSSESIGAISKLYLSSLSLDSSGNHITAIKSFYEALILNNSGNTDLIKKANYFVQKCKAALKQYTSALQGFQEIINQNPYSFEGLIASWDYAAVLLLANSGGGFSNVQLKEQNALTFEPSNILTFKRFSPFTFRVSESSVLLSSNDMLDSLRNKKTNITSYTNDNYDKKIFSKKDREIININVQKSYIDNRSKQIAKVQDLENKSKSKNETERNNAKKDLKTMKTLGEVVKVKKPKDIKEHIFNINSDIKKVFENDKISGKKDAKMIIPTEYKLYQNYPNPFNPMTKINYDLPKDAKVTLIIYDILGREMKRLVNNEFKSAGKYSIEFNGQPFASGVYFYRLVSEKYVEVKKMVLIK